MAPMYHKRLSELIALLFVLLFAYTAASKLLVFDPVKTGAGFAAPLQPYALWIGVAGPVVALMAAFTLYVGVLLLSGVELPCTCGGVINSLTWVQHFWFNLGLLLLGGVGVWSGRRAGVVLAV